MGQVQSNELDGDDDFSNYIDFETRTNNEIYQVDKDEDEDYNSTYIDASQDFEKGGIFVFNTTFIQRTNKGSKDDDLLGLPKSRSASTSNRNKSSVRINDSTRGGKYRWFSLRKKKKKGSDSRIVTCGKTLNVDNDHDILVFSPDTFRALKQKINEGCQPSQKISVNLDGSKGQVIGSSQIILQDEAFVRAAYPKHLRKAKDIARNSSIVCGTQIFVKRFDPNELDQNSRCESAPPRTMANKPYQLPGGFERIKALNGLNLVTPTLISYDKLDEILDIISENIHMDDQDSIKDEPGNTKIVHASDDFNVFRNSSNLCNTFSAIVTRGAGREIFGDHALSSTSIRPVKHMIRLYEGSNIYVCDIGLTSAQCEFIIDTAERCSRGTYASYTYAKQTLGCRDYDELATVCEWPVMRAISSINRYLESANNGRPKRKLILDDREPHLVKYDTSKKERQKLDMHTDKSEWTFLIALSEGNGVDYDGGGTYMESLGATVHLQQGHALIFRGRDRHCGQKIVNGSRFLLVGFLVEDKMIPMKRNNNAA